jgi:hypothetical protein
VRQVSAVVGSCAVLLLVLRLGTIGADSETTFGLVRLPSPTPSPGEVCKSFAQFWMEISGDGPDAVAAVSRCRQEANGGWRLPQAGRAASRRDAARASEIQSQLAGLNTMLPADLRRSLAGLQVLVATPESGRAPLDPGEEIRTEYTRILHNYLQDPAHRKLAAYVAWVVDRRDAAVATFLEGCSNYPRVGSMCDEVARSVGGGLLPWPWELRDNQLVAEYVARRPERGERALSADPLPSPSAN